MGLSFYYIRRSQNIAQSDTPQCQSKSHKEFESTKNLSKKLTESGKVTNISE